MSPPRSLNHTTFLAGTPTICSSLQVRPPPWHLTDQIKKNVIIQESIFNTWDWGGHMSMETPDVQTNADLSQAWSKLSKPILYMTSLLSCKWCESGSPACPGKIFRQFQARQHGLLRRICPHCHPSCSVGATDDQSDALSTCKNVLFFFVLVLFVFVFFVSFLSSNSPFCLFCFIVFSSSPVLFIPLHPLLPSRFEHTDGCATAEPQTQHNIMRETQTWCPSLLLVSSLVHPHRSWCFLKFPLLTIFFPSFFRLSQI